MAFSLASAKKGNSDVNLQEENEGMSLSLALLWKSADFVHPGGRSDLSADKLEELWINYNEDQTQMKVTCL